MTNTKKIFAGAFAAIATALLAALLFVGATPAHAITLDASEAGIQVSDDITRLDVQKLDADTHDPVVGAEMQIIKKSTGEVVDSWTTTNGVHSNDKQLDVNVRYILREISAPDGYALAKDTEFYIDETEGVGVHIISGDDAELTQSYNINVYDKKQATTNEITVTKSINTGNKITTSSKIPVTGDTLFVVIAGLATVVVAAVIAIIVARKKSK